MAKESMIKIGPMGKSSGNEWDEKHHSEIVQIFVSYDTIIHSIQFQHLENEKLVLSDRHGQNTGDKFSIVKLEPPFEHIVYVKGCYGRTFITSITFVTNSGTYGPFGEPLRTDKEFMIHLGSREAKNQFGGFHGAADNVLRSIGMYIKPITDVTRPSPPKRTTLLQKFQNFFKSMMK